MTGFSMLSSQKSTGIRVEEFPHGPGDLLRIHRCCFIDFAKEMFEDSCTDGVLLSVKKADRHGQSHCVRWCSTASKQQPRVSFKAKDYQTQRWHVNLHSVGVEQQIWYISMFFVCLDYFLPFDKQTGNLLFAAWFSACQPFNQAPIGSDISISYMYHDIHNKIRHQPFSMRLIWYFRSCVMSIKFIYGYIW